MKRELDGPADSATKDGDRECVESPRKRQAFAFGAGTAKMDWSMEGSVMIGKFHGGQQAPPTSRMIASFDFDGTLVTPNGTHAFSKSPDDWKLWAPAVRAKIVDIAATHRVVIFSNQLGITDPKKDPNKAKIFKGKVERFAKVVDIPMIVFAATKDDEHRKPRTGMWEQLITTIGDRDKIDISNSFFCGDAAGRAAGKGRKKKDHSDSDLKFSLNIGVQFKLPEEFFLGDSSAASEIPPIHSANTFNPTKFHHRQLSVELRSELFQPSNTPLVKDSQQELVILIGAPGSGKSSFAKKHLESKGYFRVNQDTLKTRAACIKKTRETLSAKRSVVVDNTNGDAKVRQEFLAVARELKVPARAFLFTADRGLCEHNTKFRAIVRQNSDEERGMIPDVAFHTYQKSFKEPELKEGFEEVKRINFIPAFESEEIRDKWLKWY